MRMYTCEVWSLLIRLYFSFAVHRCNGNFDRSHSCDCGEEKGWRSEGRKGDAALEEADGAEGQTGVAQRGASCRTHSDTSYFIRFNNKQYVLLCEHVDWRELHPEYSSGGLLSDQNHAHTQSAVGVTQVEASAVWRFHFWSLWIFGGSDCWQKNQWQRDGGGGGGGEGEQLHSAGRWREDEGRRQRWWWWLTMKISWMSFSENQTGFIPHPHWGACFSPEYEAFQNDWKNKGQFPLTVNIQNFNYMYIFN